MNLKKLLLLFLINKSKSFGVSRRLLLANTGPLIHIRMAVDNDESKDQQPNTLLQEESNEIYFYGEVSPMSCFVLKNKINEMTKKSIKYSLNYQNPPFPIHLHIQSGGGSLFPTLYLIDLIKKSKIVPIYTYVDGFAASAATLLSVVGNKRFMTKNSLMLIHQLSSGTDAGKYSEIKDQVQNMDSLMEIIVNTYKENTLLKDNELLELLQKDIWLNATQCLQYGLIDEIIE
jgi:ATP-dependent protease ClpP protease subunit